MIKKEPFFPSLISKMTENRNKFRIAKERKKWNERTALNNNPFNLWRHGLKSLIIAPPEVYDTNANKTDIGVGVVAVSLFHLENNMRWSGLELSSRHYCWTDMKDRDPASISDIVSYQICHNLIQFAQDSVVRLSDPSPTRIITQLKELAQVAMNRRCLFIYNGQGAPEPISTTGITLSPDETLGGDQITATQLIQAMPIPSCFIFDADYSGLLYDEPSNPNLHQDRFAFFSCGPKENLPHRIGLPADLFTSCLLTPAYVALLWGSRQFYAFTAGGLHEFPLSYFSDENGVRPHLVSFTYEIERLLSALVHAMAYSMIPCELLYNCFYRDQKVGKLFVNFCLSRRIGAEIGFRPMCYPAIPDFSQHQLWEYFDLYLDRVLLRLTQMDASISVSQSMISGDFSAFLEDALIAIEHILDLKVFESIPNEISLLPLILSESALFTRGIVAVCRFIDISEDTLRSTICYGMMSIIMQMPYRSNPDLLLPVAYAAAKMQCYALKNDNILKSFTCSTIPLYPLLFDAGKRYSDFRYPLLALILMTAATQLEYGDGSNDLEPDIFMAVIESVSSRSKPVAYWALLYLGQFLALMSDPWNSAKEYGLLEKLAIAEISPDPEMRAASIATYTSLNDFDNETPENIQERFKHLITTFINDASMLVRIQLLLFAQRFLESEVAFTRNFSSCMASAINLITMLSSDPFHEICDVAKCLLGIISSPKQDDENHIQNTGLTSSIVDNSITAFLLAQYLKLSKYTAAPFNLPATPPSPPTYVVVQKNVANDYRFTEIDQYKHNCPIVTEPVYLGIDRIVFGDQEGNINIRNISTHKPELQYPWHFFFSQVIHSHHIHKVIQIGEASLILLSNSGEIALVNNILSNFPRSVDCFTLLPNTLGHLDDVPATFYSFSDQTLYSSVIKGEIRPWSFEQCAFGQSITAGDSWINTITGNRDSPLHLAIGGTDFRYIDCRSRDSQIVVTTPSSVHVIEQSWSKPTTYNVVLENGSMYDIDIRSPETPVLFLKEHVRTVATCSWAPLTLISENTLNLYDLQRRTYPVLNIVYPTSRVESVQYASFHPNKRIFNFVVQNNTLCTVGLSEI